MRYFGFLFIGVIFFLLIISLVLTIIYFEYSPWYYLGNIHNSFDFLENNTTVSTNDVNTWAVRGQIGDILAGHFSALAFFAIALSIYFQSEGNKKLQKSIEQQETLIKQQSNALKIQSDALQVQTEEFIRNNINVRLEKYNKTLDKHLETVTEDYFNDYDECINIIKNFVDTPLNSGQQIKMDKCKESIKKQALKIKPIVMTLDLIYSEILEIKDSYPNIYQIHIKELRSGLLSSTVLYHVVTSFEDFDKQPIYILIKSMKEQK